ncbi:MAG: OmpP1/FadL family transporter, partial [Bdellovibrionales bacterium]
DPAIVPNFYLTQQVTDRFWVGIGAGSPFGLGNEYDSDWFGRYDSIKSDLTTFEVYPTAAIKVNDWLSVGASMIFQYADAELTNALNAGTQGLQTLEGEGYAVGGNIGILAEPWAGTRFGLDYRTTVENTLDGRLIVAGSTGADLDISARADLRLPDIATFSAAHDLNDRWTVLGSATWFGWNEYNRIEIINSAGTPVGVVDQNYNVSWAFSVGAEYMLNDAWTLRAGYQFDQTPTNDAARTTRTPDGDRHWITAGATYTLNDQWSFDVAGAYIDVANEEINLSRNITAIPAVVTANTEGRVGIVSAALNYRF